MKTTFLKLLSTGFLLAFMLGIILSPAISHAQDAQDADTVSASQDNSSSFNDSVQFDDMEPIFYEAVEEEVEPVSDSGSNIMLYVGAAVVLLIILIVLKKVGKKKS